MCHFIYECDSKDVQLSSRLVKKKKIIDDWYDLINYVSVESKIEARHKYVRLTESCELGSESHTRMDFIRINKWISEWILLQKKRWKRLMISCLLAACFFHWIDSLFLNFLQIVYMPPNTDTNKQWTTNYFSIRFLFYSSFCIYGTLHAYMANTHLYTNNKAKERTSSYCSCSTHTQSHQTRI